MALVNTIAEGTDAPLGHRPYASVVPYQDLYHRYTYALGGVPFLPATSNGDPIIRRTATFRTTQFDASSQPGEQSLTGWWLRSQTSFHFGSGLLYEEPAIDEDAIYRFADAEGVNVWTPGQVTMLADTQLQFTSPVPAASMLCIGAATSGGNDVVVWANGTQCGLVTTAANYTFTYDTSPTTNFQSITSDGVNAYLASGDGIWQAVLPASPGTVVAHKLWTFTASTAVLGWCMGRVMAGIGQSLYQLEIPTSGTQPYALPATPIYTSLVSGWVWSSISAGASKIYASGYAGNRGSILAVNVDNTGLLPTLSGATEVAQLPTGEWPLIVRAYLGSFLAIGSNRGVRVAQVDTAGDISYGPLVTTPQAVRDMAGQDRFVFCGYPGGFSDGSSGILRIDLGQTNTDGRNAYAKDLKAAGVTGFVRNVCNIGNSGNVAFSIDGSGIYFQSTTQVVATGYLQTARIRYDTMYQKLFRQINVFGNIQGSLSMSTVDSNNAVVGIVSVNSSTDLSQDFAIQIPSTPQVYLSVLFGFTRDSSHLLGGPSFFGYQVKALPAGPRPRQWVVPVLCFDSEKDQDGVSGGYSGFGFDRLSAVESLDSAGAVILFEDLKNKRSWLVQIDQIEFRQEGIAGTRGETWGGILNLVLRTVDG